ncbi:threonine/serine ThrE exporter family protein [Cellulomonas marina]|uniref:Uncharacterized membrane protein YjjP, DUF1212 family n=1 Tax=Cellulomonas marina TaxID=988821 RepID=A0A1I1AZP2_9CELL|nr:threonine/serine exporter family protein [Cellulomonas marina]GIG30731.1 hypothetical protein Cma02nite_33310 [Cellulomonas marina]SFB41733.1 Uncharacterized membrane protein YjjP, DUF1212 family [Cellulomonas marina]
MRWDVRHLTRRARGGPPRVPVAARPPAAGLDTATVHGVLELAVRTGEAMLSLGAAAADVTAAIHRLVAAFGLVGTQVDLTFTSITVSNDLAGTGTSVTVMRVAGSRTADYDRLARVLDLAADLSGRRVPTAEAAVVVDAAHLALDEVLAAPAPYRPAVVTLVLSVMAAGVSVLLGGGAWVALLAGGTTAVIDRTMRALARWGLPPFFLQVVGASVATAVAVLLLVLVPLLPVELATLPPSLVVASGIVVLLAGLSLVGAAEDAIGGFPVTASGRVFEVVLLTLGIVVGIGGVLDVARRLGVRLEVVDEFTGAAPVGVQAVAAAVVAGAWALSSYARPRAAAVAAAAGGTAWLLFTVLRALEVGPGVASAGAALAVGFASESLAPRLRVPALVTATCAIVPLLPGLAIYRGLFLVVDDGSSLLAGAEVLLEAATVGLGLAAGVTLGEILAAPVHRRARSRRHPDRAGRVLTS